MKYSIDQIVYSIDSRCGQIEISELKIDNIGKSTLGYIFYSGTVINDPEQIPNTLTEDRLFASRKDAIANLYKQIALLEDE